MKAIVKKTLGLFMILVVVVMCLAGCGIVDKGKEIVNDIHDEFNNEFSVPKREFYFSTDNGKTYGNRQIEFEVGKSVYMQLIIRVESSDADPYDVKGELKIPNVKSVDAYYMKGQKITPNQDDINGYTTYPFTVTTNEDWTFFFEFVPNGEETVQMDLSFDDQVPEKYDMINTIKMVTGTPKQDEANNSEAEPTKEGE